MLLGQRQLQIGDVLRLTENEFSDLAYEGNVIAFMDDSGSIFSLCSYETIKDLELGEDRFYLCKILPNNSIQLPNNLRQNEFNNYYAIGCGSVLEIWKAEDFKNYQRKRLKEEDNFMKKLMQY